MKIETLYDMTSPYRDHFRIRGYHFGEGEKTVAIVGAMRGDEIQQQYICARLVSVLEEIEKEGRIVKGCGIMVIPSCNPFSMNVSHRFWTMDGTDINRMFPGYDKGETSQRIAAALFEQLQDYEYGMQLTSFYLPGDFVPHVRMLKTGYEDVEGARLFGLPFVTVRKPTPYDTTLLNYNWQLWNVKAYSLYAGQTDHVGDVTSAQTVDAILRFLNNIKVIRHRVWTAGYDSVVIDEGNLINVIAHDGGIFTRDRGAGEQIRRGERIGAIIDPFDGSVREEFLSPVDGTIFFAHHRPLALEHGIVFRIQPYDQ